MDQRWSWVLAFVLAVCVVAVDARAQRSAAAGREAGSWFNNAEDTTLQRMAAMQKQDVDVWEAAAKKAGISVDRADLGFAIPKFNLLFDPKSQVVPGAMAKYSKRLSRLPMKAVKDWGSLTGGELLVVAMSLTAENRLFPGEMFSDAAFRSFLARFKS